MPPEPSRAMRAAFAILCALVAASSASAQDEAGAGKLAYREQRFDEAARLLKPLGDAGDVEAQYLLGQIYFFGLGRTERSDAEAARWYARPAESGNAEAMYRLGYLFASGQGVAQSGEQAAAWWLKAAAQGH